MWSIYLLIMSLANICFKVDSYSIEEYTKHVTLMLRDPRYKADLERNIKKLLKQEPNYFDYTPFKSANYTFDCDTQHFVSPEVPKSVHELRPGDIRVVSALGDSITAAAGGDAKTIIGLLTEYRERSWSIGGKGSLEQIVTLPNILKKFNPQLKGATDKNNFILLGKEGKYLQFC